MTSENHILNVPASVALESMRSNKLRRYPHPDRDGERLYPLANPQTHPSFEITVKDSVFAIGSCFARNIERTLVDLGMHVPSQEFDFGVVGAEMARSSSLFNKYSVHSMLNELQWALERETYPEDDLIFTLPGGVYADLQLGMTRLEYPMDEIKKFRNSYLDTMAQVKNADVIIITLGYVEAWYDNKMGIYINAPAPASLVKEDPTRFSFHVLGYQDVLKGMNDIYELLKKHRTKPMRMLVTVSPVPLLATFRDMDVLVANTYSKSVQRAALEEFSNSNEGVDYFPSYEFVTMSDPNAAWARDDYRHVSPYLVTRIMHSVVNSYFPEIPDETRQAMHASETVAHAQLLNNRKDWDALRNLLLENSDLIETNVDMLVLMANCFRQEEEYQDTFDTIEKAYQLDPNRPALLERMIWLTEPLNDKKKARELLKLHAHKYPKRHSDFKKKINWSE